MAEAVLARLPVRRVARYGWKPDLPDRRDHRFLAIPATVRNLPAHIDLRTSNKWPLVYDQGRIGSCTANAIAAAYEFLIMKEGQTDFMPSRLFIYYNERSIENTVPLDSGANLRDGMVSLTKLGVCPETVWPYDDTPADEKTNLWPANAKAGIMPNSDCFIGARSHVALEYRAVGQTLDQLRGCIAQGFPFIFGFVVYDSFESQTVAETGIVPMPQDGEKIIGGHAVCCVGYDNTKQMFLVRNSWGAGWGIEGHFWIPYAYLTDSNLANSFWMLTKND